MWHTPEGEQTFTGPFALALSYCIWNMTSEMEANLDEPDLCSHGHRAFDRLTNEQKIWVLHRVAFGLLDAQTAIVPLTACVEATVATIFRRMEEDIDGEIQLTQDDPDEDYSSLRRAVLAAYELAGGNDPENIMEDEEPLRVECDDLDEWKTAIEILEGNILWDGDYDLDILDDMPPEQGNALKGEAGISDDYFAAVAEDPKRSEALKLLKETRKLCDRVIAREEKKLSK